MKTIIIKSKKHGTHYAMVDDQDFEFLCTLKWNIAKVSKRRITYPIARNVNPKNMLKVYPMHRIIIGINDPTEEIDHIDRNGLNNQRDNLRRATSSQNKHNTGLIRSNTTGFKGVSNINKYGRYRVHICNQRKITCGGSYSTSVEAAYRWNELSRQQHGEFAYQNPVTAIKYADGTMYTHEVKTPCSTPTRDKDFITEQIRTFIPC